MPSASEVYAAREKNRIYIPRDRYLSEEAEKKAMAEKIERMELEADSKDKQLMELYQLYNCQQLLTTQLSDKLEKTEKNLEETERSLVDLEERQKQANATIKEKELSSQQEYLKLKARYEALQRSQRNLMGEDLGLLSSKELESLERQLDSSLKLIRSTRTQFMLDQLSKLQRKEHLLSEANRALRQRQLEGYQINPMQLNPGGVDDMGYARHPPQPQPDPLFQQLDCEPTLQIGYQPDPVSVVTAGPSMGNYMGGWLP